MSEYWCLRIGAVADEKSGKWALWDVGWGQSTVHFPSAAVDKHVSLSKRLGHQARLVFRATVRGARPTLAVFR
jgi:hypothetical protein